MKNREPLNDEDVVFLFNALRKASITWSGRKEALMLARKKIFVRRAKNGRAVSKYTWQCAICFKWFWNEKQMEVDHIEEIGGVGGFRGDWNEVMARIFPRPVIEHLQVCCIACHLKKTLAYKNATLRYKRKREP